MKLITCLSTVLTMSTICAQASKAAIPASVAEGSYECRGNGSPRLLLSFKVTGKGSYTDIDGKERGSFTYDRTTGAIAFQGGHLDGVMPKGFTSVYHEPKNFPTVSFRGKGGYEASYCEPARK